MSMSHLYLLGVVIGVVGEGAAYLQRLWVYRRPLYPVMNVLVMFGLVMGTLAALTPRLGVLPVFLVAFVVGLTYEVANLRVLHWWTFPGERLYLLRGHAQVVVAISLLWGAVPLLVVALAGWT